MRLVVLHTLVGLCAAAICVGGCGKSSNEAQAPEPTLTVDAATAGSITGTVTLVGQPPQFKPLDMSAESYCVQANPAPVIPPIVVTGDKGALANAVVYVKGDMADYRFDVPQQPAVVDQKGCMYEPHVLAMMANQPFHVTNSDDTLHNIHPVPHTNRSWNQSQPQGAPPIDRKFTKPELAIQVNCNVHPWMRGYLFVFRHPFYAVTTKTGTFSISGLPPGTYTIEAWQERFGAQDQTVTIGAKESKAIAFTFTAPPAHSGN
jgi:hypothetical protein